MKKRKELDALVANVKVRKKSGSSSHELLQNDSDTTDTEDFSVLHPRKSLLKNGGSASRLCAACVPLCMLTLVTACVVGSGMLIWMHFGLREEVDMLRNYIKKVEAGTRGTPEEFHNIHMQLKDLEWNSTRMREDIHKMSADVSLLSKDIDMLKQTADSLRKSIAAAPQIETLPKDVLSLQQSLAGMGSKITDLETNLKEMKDQYGNTCKQLQTDVQSLKMEMQSMSSEAQNQMTTVVPSSFYTEEITRLNTQLDEINKTLGEKIKRGLITLQAHQLAISEFENVTSNITKRIHLIEMKTDTSYNVKEQVQNAIQEQLNNTLKELERKQGSLSDEIIQLRKNSTGLASVLASLGKIVDGLITKADTSTAQTNSDFTISPLAVNLTGSLPKQPVKYLQEMSQQNISQILETNSSFQTEDSTTKPSNTKRSKQLNGTT